MAAGVDLGWDEGSVLKGLDDTELIELIYSTAVSETPDSDRPKVGRVGSSPSPSDFYLANFLVNRPLGDIIAATQRSSAAAPRHAPQAHHSPRRRSVRSDGGIPTSRATTLDPSRAHRGNAAIRWMGRLAAVSHTVHVRWEGHTRGDCAGGWTEEYQATRESWGSEDTQAGVSIDARDVFGVCWARQLNDPFFAFGTAPRPRPRGIHSANTQFSPIREEPLPARTDWLASSPSIVGPLPPAIAVPPRPALWGSDRTLPASFTGTRRVSRRVLPATLRTCDRRQAGFRDGARYLCRGQSGRIPPIGLSGPVRSGEEARERCPGDVVGDEESGGEEIRKGVMG